MKKLISILAVASFVVAAPCMAQIKIKGNSKQEVNVDKGGIVNTANAGAIAKQNVASNKGKVTIEGNNTQQVNVKMGGIVNQSAAGATAEQNLATNSSN